MAKKVTEDVALAEPTETVDSTAPESVRRDEQYIVTTDNPKHTGVIMGIQITNGRGLLNRQSIDPRLGRDFDQVLAEMRVMPGYHLTRAA